ncbi:hypothetical protein BN938_0761 [Mucinivorans hirudinis]|uniref:N-acetyltransferase domain-containing protein n=1 Tax=Mucinivorans hirudinis TaxID=1433126 RepID=A0A060R6Y6_9BACT|nr:hypothetical protein BN938_0761 [Mucinivorans hirudinis]
MIVRLLKFLKNKSPFVWQAIEYCNGLAVSLFYGNKIRKATMPVFTNDKLFAYRELSVCDLTALETMLSCQPYGFDEFFKPHNFDIKTLKRLFRNPAFLMLGAFDGEKIAGYFFIRFFTNRTAFRGKMVDAKYQGKGIAKEMGRIMTEIALGAGFRLFATISKSNYGSMASSVAVNEIKIIKELPNNYLYIEYSRKC